MSKGRVILLGAKPKKVHSYTMVYTVGELKEVTVYQGNLTEHQAWKSSLWHQQVYLGGMM